MTKAISPTQMINKPLSKIVLGTRIPVKKAAPLNKDELFKCGTPYLQSLHRAVKKFEDGEAVDDGFTVDEVEMAVLDDWERVGCMSTKDQGWVDIFAPLIAVDGITERLLGDDEIEGFKPLRGHEYRIKVRRFYITEEPFYHVYKMLDIIYDKSTQL